MPTTVARQPPRGQATPPASRQASRVPGGFFVIHSAYGRLGDADVGGVEIIAYDPASERYQSYFFDSQGNTAVNRLSFSNDRWLWQGENTRSTSVFTDEGKTQTTLHERRDEGGNWVPSMDVVLTEVA
jgi:Protein of unknown function (DUF1579)